MSIPFILSGPGFGPPALPADQWGTLGLTWTGHDGSEWDFTDTNGGVLLDRRGVEGLHFPRITKYKSSSRGVAGNRSRGWRTEAREVFWPVYLWGDSSREWLDRCNAFFATIHPDLPGTWAVTGLDGSIRELSLTGVFDDTHVYTVDPMQRGWEQYGVALEADQPYWQGALIQRGPWRAPDPQPFFPGPPFTISAGSAFGSAAVPNPGDVLAHGVWWARGPVSAVELGVGDAVITVPFEVPDGQLLRIDTDPRRPRATMGAAVPRDELDEFVGTDMTQALGLQRYAGVPPGRSVDLHVEATGTGEISFHLRPLYFRAF